MKFSFGTYRTTKHNPVHKKALIHAIENGITDIDTSTNYIFGEAEELIGGVIKEFKREDLSIVSKAGYIQGPTMKRVQDGWNIDDLVEYDKSCFHSISPMFLEDQLDNSLKRLDTEYIDTYLLHNPEYYLMSNLKGDATDEDLDKHHKIMNERIITALNFLEEQVKKGKIKSYGISSNSFSKAQNDYHFLDYKNFEEYKDKGFKVIQLPMNMFEKDGVPCAKWAHENGFEVHVNRPLNAFYMGGMLRLASYDNCDKFNELLTQVKNIPNKKIQALIKDLLENQERFGFAGDVDDTIEYQVIPFIIQQSGVDSKYYSILDKFLECYKANIKHSLGKITAKQLDLAEPLDKTALKYLTDKFYIDKVLVGMRTQKYVDKVLSYIND